MVAIPDYPKENPKAYSDFTMTDITLPSYYTKTVHSFRPDFELVAATKKTKKKI